MRLTLPLQGAWVAALEVAADEVLTGALALKQDELLTYSGNIVRSGVVAGRCLIEAVGGTGGLLQDVAARSYQGAGARTVVGDLLAEVGETLDSSSTRAVLASTLTYWTRGAGRASTALSTLVDALGARWRVLPSGAVWVGTETYPAVGADYSATELDRDAGAGLVLLAPETIALRPGVALAGERIGRVEHVMSRAEPLRTTAWLEA